MQILRDLWRLIRSWWQVDRIRISPSEGRLWRLDPPCVVFVDGTPVEVLRKLPTTQDASRVVEYECLCAGREARLAVNGDSARSSLQIVDRAGGRHVQRSQPAATDGRND